MAYDDDDFTDDFFDNDDSMTEDEQEYIDELFSGWEDFESLNDLMEYLHEFDIDVYTKAK